MNKGLMGLELHEGEKFMTQFSFLGELSLQELSDSVPVP